MFAIKNIKCRKVLNCHVQFTNEYTIELIDGSIGTGSAPKGETISIYEDRGADIKPEFITNKIKQDGLCGVSINQKQMDDYLEKNISIIGANNVFAALSQA
jgi:enolase